LSDHGPGSLRHLLKAGVWEEFRGENDLLGASHRGLQCQLIGEWMRESKILPDRIESSAYGETPPIVMGAMLDALAVEFDELFVDLGCGGGNVCAAALRRQARVLGIERNPELIKAARAFLIEKWAPLELRCADFLETDWSEAEVAYTASTRFPDSVLEALARRAEAAPRLRAMACLGRPLVLGGSWREEIHGEWPVVWNPGEEVQQEPLFVYFRSVG
jgi:SAM-dependent methyltransferase